MKLRLEEDKPFTFFSPRRLAYVEKESLREILDDYLKDGIVRQSESEYCSQIVLVKKKLGGIRMCIDYRKLNKITVKV